MVFDSMTKKGKGNISEVNNENDFRFYYGLGLAHNVFNQNDVSQIILCDHTGITYGRKIFTTETYFKQNIITGGATPPASNTGTSSEKVNLTNSGKRADTQRTRSNSIGINNIQKEHLEKIEINARETLHKHNINTF